MNMKLLLPYALGAILAPTLAAAAAAAAASPWILPKPTLYAPVADSPGPVPTAPARLGRALFARNDLLTCGYIDNRPEAAVTCPDPSYECATNSLYGVHGCCDPKIPRSKCTIPTSCVASTQLKASCGTSCSADDAITKCTDSSAPACYTLYVVYGSVTVVEHGCTTSAYTLTAHHSTETSTLSNSALVTVIINNTPTTSTSTATPGTSKSHIGPIVGGTVAGCVVVACLLITFFVLRRRRARNAPPNTQKPLPGSPSPSTVVEVHSPFPPHALPHDCNFPVTEYDPHGFTPYAHPHDAKWAPEGAVWRPEVQRYAVEVDGAAGRVEVPG